MGLFTNDDSTQGLVIGATPLVFPANTVGEMTINGLGQQRVAQGLPPLAELVRLANSYAVRTASAFAALTTIPTTAAAFSLYNGEADNGKSYIIDKVFLVEIVVDATQQNQASVWALINKANGGFTPVTDTLAANIRNLTGKSGAYGGLARVAVTGTITDEGWMPIGNSVAGAATVAGGAWRNTEIDLQGRYIVRPKSQFNLHVVKIAATASQCHIGVVYHEVQLDLG